MFSVSVSDGLYRVSALRQRWQHVLPVCSHGNRLHQDGCYRRRRWGLHGAGGRGVSFFWPIRAGLTESERGVRLTTEDSIFCLPNKIYSSILNIEQYLCLVEIRGHTWHGPHWSWTFWTSEGKVRELDEFSAEVREYQGILQNFTLYNFLTFIALMVFSPTLVETSLFTPL